MGCFYVICLRLAFLLLGRLKRTPSVRTGCFYVGILRHVRGLLDGSTAWDALVLA